MSDSSAALGTAAAKDSELDSVSADGGACPSSSRCSCFASLLLQRWPCARSLQTHARSRCRVDAGDHGAVIVLLTARQSRAANHESSPAQDWTWKQHQKRSKHSEHLAEGERNVARGLVSAHAALTLDDVGPDRRGEPRCRAGIACTAMDHDEARSGGGEAGAELLLQSVDRSARWPHGGPPSDELCQQMGVINGWGGPESVSGPKLDILAW